MPAPETRIPTLEESMQQLVYARYEWQRRWEEAVMALGLPKDLSQAEFLEVLSNIRDILEDRE